MGTLIKKKCKRIFEETEIKEVVEEFETAASGIHNKTSTPDQRRELCRIFDKLNSILTEAVEDCESLVIFNVAVENQKTSTYRSQVMTGTGAGQILPPGLKKTKQVRRRSN